MSKFINLTSKSNVNELNEVNSLLNSNSESIVLVHANWCGHCKTFMNQQTGKWNDFTNQIKSNMNVIQIEADAFSKLKQNKLNVTSFPSLFHMKNNEVREFDGADRELNTLLNFVGAKSGGGKKSKKSRRKNKKLRSRKRR